MTSTRAPDTPDAAPPEAEEAYAYAIRLLAQAPRTESLLRDRLARAGFGDATEVVLGRLVAARLVDDAAYARDFVEGRARRRPLGRDLLLVELEARGIDASAAARALDDVGYDEGAAAAELASRRLARLTSLPLPEQARKLFAFLAGRGFSQEVAEAAVRQVLPPEGWD